MSIFPAAPKRRALPACLLVLPFLAGCGGDVTGSGPTEDRVVAQVVVGPADSSVPDGGTVQLHATLVDQHGNTFSSPPAGVVVNWSSGNTAIATVSASGLVTGERPGSATIAASAAGSTGSTAVTVTRVATELTAVAGEGQQADPGATLPEQLVVLAVDRHGDPVPDVAVTWTVTAGGGTVEPAAPATDADGRVQATWTLGADPGQNQVEASLAAGVAAAVFVSAAVTSQVDCGQTVTLHTGDTLEGQLPGVLLRGHVVVTGPATICGDLAFGLPPANDSTRLVLNGQTVTVAGDLAIPSGGGFLVMTDPADRLEVAGNVFFGGTSATGNLTAGELRVSGDFGVQGSQNQFYSTGTRVVLDGTGPQAVAFTSTSHTGAIGSRFNDLVITNPTTVSFAAPGVLVQGDLTVEAATALVGGGVITVAGDLATAAGSSIEVARVRLAGGRGTADVEGTFSPGITQFVSTDAQNPQPVRSGLDYQDLLVTGASRLDGPVLVSGNLTLGWDNGLTGSLDLGGHTLTVDGDLSAVSGGGPLIMQDAADLLILKGNAFFGGASATDNLTAGEVRVSGDFGVQGSQNQFYSTGTKVLLNGTEPQAVAFTSTSHTGAIGSRFNDLVITNPTTVSFAAPGVRVQGDLTVEAATALVGGGVITVAGDLATAAGSSIEVARVRLAGSRGTADVEGAFSPGTTQFVSTDAQNPQRVRGGLAYKDLVVTGASRLDGPVLVSGNVTLGWDNGLTGSLDLGGHTLTVEGDLSAVSGGGPLIMQDAADLLILKGNAFFGGASATDNLTAGELRVSGDFGVQGSQNQFYSTGTKVVLDGTEPQAVTFTSTSHTGAIGSRFHDLVITSGADVTLGHNTRVGNDLDLVGVATVPNGATVTVLGSLLLRASAVLTNDGTLDVSGCGKEDGHMVNGTDPCP